MGIFRIERLIGTGGMAVVYRAHWLLPGGHELPVACKLMHEERHLVPTYRELVRQEAVLGLQVTGSHPNLVRVLDFFEDTEGRLCMALELVDGGTLADLHRACAQLPFAVTRRIGLDILEALAHLHAQDVLHRDVSPSNVLLARAGAVKVSDLGLAKVMEHGAAHTGTIRGKVFYASPETLQCMRLDARSDLYSLGAVLYELLAGNPPYQERELPRLILRMSHEDMAPLPAHVPEDLAALTRGLLRTEPRARVPRSAREAIALLRDSGQPIASRADLAGLMAALGSDREVRGAGALRPLEPGTLLVPRAPAPPEPRAAAPLLPPRRTRDMPPPGERLRVVVEDASSTQTRDVLAPRGGRGMRIAALMAACFALGSLFHDRFWSSGDPAETRPVRAPAQPGQPAVALPECTPAAAPAEHAASHTADLAAAAKETTRAAPAQRKRGRSRSGRDPAVSPSRRKPKNVAPLAKIPR